MSSVDWVPQLSAALDRLVPLEDGSQADWDDVVGRVGGPHHPRLWQRRPRRSVRLTIVVALLFLLLTGVATATYLLLRGNGGIALGGGTTLPVVNPNGPGLHAVANCSDVRPNCTTSEPAWSPDGTRLAYLSGRYGGPRGTSHFSLFVAASDGGGARRVARCGGCAGQWGSSLAWSPDGKWIAYSRDDGPTGQASIWIVAAAGGKPRQLTRCSGWCADIDPRWSPTGDLLVFQRITIAGSKRTNNTLYAIRQDGSGLTRIASGADPEWSPHGSRIVFDGAGGIEVANADGSDAHLLAAETGGTGPGAPSWSPDGSKLVYFATPGQPGHFVAEVWTMNPDGSGKKLLYRSGCCVQGWAAPIWSPDGAMIAFSANSAGGTFVMNADGSGLHRISTGTYSGLSWQGVP